MKWNARLSAKKSSGFLLLVNGRNRNVKVTVYQVTILSDWKISYFESCASE